MKKRLAWTKYALGFAGRFILNKCRSFPLFLAGRARRPGPDREPPTPSPTAVILFPLQFIPLLGIVVSSFVKALGTARLLHRPYYASKNMTEDQIDVFIEERKWDYLAFGFTAALLESLPFVGMLFSVRPSSLSFPLACRSMLNFHHRSPLPLPGQQPRWRRVLGPRPREAAESVSVGRAQAAAARPDVDRPATWRREARPQRAWPDRRQE
jgi:hypothetical protein